MSQTCLSLLFFSSLVADVLASCAYGTHVHPRAEGGAVAVSNFAYTGTTSPLNWLAIDPVANIACATGTNQSPIDMTAGQFTLVSAADVQLNIPDIEETEFENLGATVEVVVPEGATMVANGTEFALQQFHFHLPSEHLDDGRTMAMEMHLVFESAAQQIAVLGVYLDTANADTAAATTTTAATAERRHARDTAPHSSTEKDRRAVIVGSGSTSRAQSLVNSLLGLIGLGGTTTTANPATSAVGVSTGATSLLDTIFASVGNIATPGTSTTIGPLTMSGLVESITAGSLQTYSGSLTTPPCSEGVSWFVSTQKQTVSLASFDAARSVIGFNSRFPQNALGQQNLLALAAENTAAAAAAAAAAA